eukprot:TRINITY_DN6527_c0_g1_i1.p1 TRINITY_DN6527_c0_g1~~TRINITY_DN6527_c0_g1_i1.p1  ORF type:complete len:260 (+),score=33.72 TRINITY_DN6527_c0_g1_i1:57-836(+)
MTSFTWKYSGNIILLYGSWDDWKEAQILTRNKENQRQVILTLSPNLYEYKFQVDGKWLYDIEQPTVNRNGIVNNIVRILAPETPKVVVCLGERLGKDGSPTAILKHRVEKAVQVARNDRTVVGIIFTGGKVSSVEHLSEAEVMKSHAVSLGFPEEQIFQEDQAKNTIENAIYSKMILQQRCNFKVCGVYLVTSNFHINRACRIFTSVLGLDYPVIKEPIEDLLSITQEVLDDRLQKERWLLGFLKSHLYQYKLSYAYEE